MPLNKPRAKGGVGQDPAWISRDPTRGFPSWKSTSFAASENSPKSGLQPKRLPRNRAGAEISCRNVEQLVVFADAGFRPLDDELVAAIALSLADMHLGSALRTGLSPRRRSGIKRDCFLRFFRLQLFHPLFVRLCFRTLRVDAGWRIGNLATNRTDFSLRSRIHRTWLFLIHGSLLRKSADGQHPIKPEHKIPSGIKNAEGHSTNGLQGDRDFHRLVRSQNRDLNSITNVTQIQNAVEVVLSANLVSVNADDDVSEFLLLPIDTA